MTRHMPPTWILTLALTLMTLLAPLRLAGATAFNLITDASSLETSSQPNQRTSPTRAQGAWLCTRPSTSLGEVDHPQRRRREDGRVGATHHLGMPKDLVSGDDLVVWSAAHSAYGKIVAVDTDGA
jgi:hypothetical protein